MPFCLELSIRTAQHIVSEPVVFMGRHPAGEVRALAEYVVGAQPVPILAICARIGIAAAPTTDGYVASARPYSVRPGRDIWTINSNSMECIGSKHFC